jgi:hypothetical protein
MASHTNSPMKIAYRCLALVLCLSTTACADDAIGDHIRFQVAFVDALGGQTLEGVEICVEGDAGTPCATSNAQGAVSLDLPAGRELMLGCRSATHGPAHMTWTIGHEDIQAGSFGLLEAGIQGALYQLSGGADFEGHGAITVNVYTDLVERDAWVPGVTMSISATEAVGPVYISEAMLPDPDLQATTIGGPGVFVDVAPGEVSVTIAHDDLPCAPGFGWASEEPLTLRSQIFAGSLSNVTFVCPSE